MFGVARTSLTAKCPRTTPPGPSTPRPPPACGRSPRRSWVNAFWRDRPATIEGEPREMVGAELVAGLKQVVVGWSAVDDLARTQRALEQLDWLRASRNGHAGLATAAGVDL